MLAIHMFSRISRPFLAYVYEGLNGVFCRIYIYIVCIENNL